MRADYLDLDGQLSEEDRAIRDTIGSAITGVPAFR